MLDLHGFAVKLTEDLVKKNKKNNDSQMSIYELIFHPNIEEDDIYGHFHVKGPRKKVNVKSGLF